MEYETFISDYSESADSLDSFYVRSFDHLLRSGETFQFPFLINGTGVMEELSDSIFRNDSKMTNIGEDIRNKIKESDIENFLFFVYDGKLRSKTFPVKIGKFSDYWDPVKNEFTVDIKKDIFPDSTWYEVSLIKNVLEIPAVHESKDKIYSFHKHSGEYLNITEDITFSGLIVAIPKTQRMKKSGYMLMFTNGKFINTVKKATRGTAVSIQGLDEHVSRGILEELMASGPDAKWKTLDKNLELLHRLAVSYPGKKEYTSMIVKAKYKNYMKEIAWETMSHA